MSLERALQTYLTSPSEEPFNMRSIPITTEPLTVEDKKPRVESREERPTATKDTAKATSALDSYVEQFKNIPQIAALGPLFKSSTPVQLTESETEYVVTCIKHTFAQDIVFQFDCTNTLNDQVLENIFVNVESQDPAFVIDGTIHCPKLECNVRGTTYTRIRIPKDDSGATGTFACTLKFLVKDCDPTTGELESEEGYEDEYVLEDVEVTLADHMQRTIVPNFASAWDEFGEENENQGTYALSQFKKLQEAVDNVVMFFGMQPLDKTEKVPEEKNSHLLVMSGVFRGNFNVLVRCKFVLNESGVAMMLQVRSDDPDINEAIIQSM